jgi:hypothetical protein
MINDRLAKQRTGPKVGTAPRSRLYGRYCRRGFSVTLDRTVVYSIYGRPGRSGKGVYFRSLAESREACRRMAQMIARQHGAEYLGITPEK